MRLVHPPDREPEVEDAPLRIRQVSGLAVLANGTGVAVRLRHNVLLPRPGDCPRALASESVDTSFILSPSAARTLMRALQRVSRKLERER